MNSARLEAFSDGVLAIIITIMVLEIPIPHEANFQALGLILPKFLAYLLSFGFIGIYWNNHHHLLKEVKQMTPGVMWANLHLLFWLSLMPFATAWLGDHYQSPWPTAFYGVITLLCAVAYTFLQKAILKHQPSSSDLKDRIGKDAKGKLSLVFYLLAIVFAFFFPWISILFYVTVAVIWFIPDRRLTKRAEKKEGIES